MEPTSREKIRAVAEKALRIGTIANLAVVASALAALLLLGEHTRPTFFLLYLPLHPFAASSALLLLLALLLRAHRLSVASIVALLVALFPLMGLRVGRSREAHGPRLRLLTYNILYAKLDRSALVAQIAGAQADVIVLQASRTSFANNELKAALPGYTVQADDEFVLATKLKILDREFPYRFPDDSLVGYVRTTLEGPTGPFRVIDVHPQSARQGLMDRANLANDVEIRRRQLGAAVEAAARGTEPVIIVGDTNLPPLSAVARKALAPYRDAFDEVGAGFGYTFPAKLPWMRIDRALGGPGIRWLAVRVLPRGASDHLPVVVDFEVEPAGSR